MAQNITIMGASYSDVPAVTLPKTGGGTAKFDDTTDANAVADDIASGKTAYVNGAKITGTASGGGGGDQADLDDVTFIDYDGTILYSYSKAQFLALSAMPANPSHTDKGLTAYGWNWTLQQAKDYVTANDYLVIGQTYRTTDGKTHIKIDVDDTAVGHNFCVRLIQSVKNGVTVDWDDGTVEVDPSNANTFQNMTHSYTNKGEYDIKVYATNGTFKAGYNGSDAGFAAQGNSESRCTRQCVKAIYFGDDCSQLNRNVTAGLYCLEELVVPATSIDLGENNANPVFRDSLMLKAVVFPQTCTYGTVGCCEGLAKLRFVSWGYGVDYTAANKATNIINGSPLLEMASFPPLPQVTSTVIGYCRNIKKIAIPGEYTSLYASFCRECTTLEKLVTPSTVTEIKDYAMSASMIKEWHIKATSPPTIANARGLPSLSGYCTIYVPYSADHSVLTAYQTATSWSSYSQYMVEESA